MTKNENIESVMLSKKVSYYKTESSKEQKLISKTEKAFPTIKSTPENINSERGMQKKSTTTINEQDNQEEDSPTPSRKKVIWPRKIEHKPEGKANLPWSDPDAQPPPPPLSHYTPFSPPSTRRQNKHAIGKIDESVSSIKDISKQSKLSKSKSESQLNRYGTLFSLSNYSDISSVESYSFKSSRIQQFGKSSKQKLAAGGKSISFDEDNAIDTRNELGHVKNEHLKLGSQITRLANEGGFGQLAKSGSYGDITATSCQSTTIAQTAEAQQKKHGSGVYTATMVTVRSNDDGANATAPAKVSDKINERKAAAYSESLKSASVKSVGAKFSGDTNVASSNSSGKRQDVPWRKSDTSAKTSHTPDTPRLDSRKKISAAPISQGATQLTPLEKKEELPDAPWRKSPQQPRKDVKADKKSSTAVQDVKKTVANNTEVEINASAKVIKEDSETHTKTNLSNAEVVTEASVKTCSILGSVSSSVELASQGSNVLATLPPHSPIPHKKLGGSPKDSPKGSPILPRKGVQPPAPPIPPPPSASKLCSEVFSVSTTATDASVATVTESQSIVQPIEEVEKLAANGKSEYVTPFEKSEAIVLQNIVSSSAAAVPLHEEVEDIFIKETVEHKVKEMLAEPPQLSTITNNVLSNESIVETDAKSAKEFSLSENNSATISSQNLEEETNVESISTNLVENLPPPPPVQDSSTNEEDNIPPLPPPPANFTATEEPLPTSEIPFNILPTEKDNDSYVRQPVTSRIKSFEKQASLDSVDQRGEKLGEQPARPVGPWVKRTSSGPVAPSEEWTPEAVTWPPPADKQDNQQQPSLQQAKQYPADESSTMPLPVSSQISSHLPHKFQPHQYRSPTQLKREQQEITERSRQQIQAYSPPSQQAQLQQQSQLLQQQQQQQAELYRKQMQQEKVQQRSGIPAQIEQKVDECEPPFGDLCHWWRC